MPFYTVKHPFHPIARFRFETDEVPDAVYLQIPAEFSMRDIRNFRRRRKLLPISPAKQSGSRIDIQPLKQSPLAAMGIAFVNLAVLADYRMQLHLPFHVIKDVLPCDLAAVEASLHLAVYVV